MREIGGYIELDTYDLPMVHEDAVALNCGRNCLAYIIRSRRIKKICLPYFICGSIPEVCEREGVETRFYHIAPDFRPVGNPVAADDEWFFFVNYYGLFGNDEIRAFAEKYPRIIVDNTNSYFQEPLAGIDTFYSCRKYFGVPDGAFLYTDAVSDGELPQDESFERMRFLLGRFERTASEFYPEYQQNNLFFKSEPVKTMSKLTCNLLHAVNYEKAEEIRKANYVFLHAQLGGMNGLKLQEEPATFMYPFMIENGGAVRKRLQ